jgi:hypothetical protein
LAHTRSLTMTKKTTTTATTGLWVEKKEAPLKQAGLRSVSEILSNRHAA